MATISLRQRYQRSRNTFSKIIQDYYKNPTLKAYLELLLSLITISVFGLFSIRPTFITIGKLLKEIDAKEDTLKVMNVKIEDIKKAQTNYQKNKDSIDILNSSVPHMSDLHKLIPQIETLAYSNSLTLGSFSSQNVSVLGESFGSVTNINKNELTFSIIVSGNYKDLVNFLSQLEDMRRPVKIESVRINPVVSSEGRGITLTLSLSDLASPFLGFGQKTVDQNKLF